MSKKNPERKNKRQNPDPPQNQPPAKKVKKGRPSKVQNAWKVTESDQYNREAWVTLIKYCQKLESVEEQRVILSAFLGVFPTNVRQLKYWIEREISFTNYDRAETLFKEFLLNIYDIELWKLYLKYIKIVKNGKSDERKELEKAYEFVLNHMGDDLYAAPVWFEYCAFLKTKPATNIFQKSERIKLVRSAYQRAVLSPINAVENLWRNYDEWEHNVNKELGKKIIGQLQSHHMLARNTYRERRRLKRAIMQNMLARPSGGSTHHEDRNYQQVDLWCNLIEYEKTNPQRLDISKLKQRVIFTYKQALITLRHYAEIWHSYALYMAEFSSVDEAVKIFEEATNAMTNNLLIHFMYAEFLENHNRVDQARAVFERLGRSHPGSLTLIQYQKFLCRTEGIAASRSLFMKMRKQGYITYHVYLAAAEQEYHVTKNKNAARKLYEIGFELFSKEPKFVIEYIDFLFHRNDSLNLRVVFERVLPQLDPKNPAARDIWKRFVEFQETQSNLQQVLDACKRRATTLESSRAMKMVDLIERHSFGDCLPCPMSYKSTLLRAIAHTKTERKAIPSRGVRKKKRGDTYPKPDLEKCYRYRPGIRFLQKLQDDEEPVKLKFSVPDKIKKLKRRLPPPELTQLFFLPGHPLMIVDVDALVDHLKDCPIPQVTHFANTKNKIKFDETRDLYAMRRLAKKQT